MAPQTGYLKEHEGIVPNSLGQLSSSPTRLWSAAFGLGSHSIFGDFGQVKEQLDSNGKEFAATKQAAHGLEKLNTAPFSIYPGDTKNSVDAQKPSPVFSLQSPLSEYHNRFELGFGQPMEQHYGILSAYGPQIPPYIHESRHLHAMRRPRGSGGRFLNMKNQPNEKSSMVPKKVDDVNLSDLTGSQCSEVLQSESGTLNSQNEAKEGRGFNLLSSEVSSMFSRGLQRFQINHIGPSMQSLAEIIDGGGHGMVLPKWVAAADNCCDLCF